ncbi:MAG TPA: cytochrome c biogenesis protein CcdA [Thermoanaerobaculia bacterium]
MLIAALVLAQITSVFAPPKQDLVKLSGSVDAGGNGVVTATIEKGWHIQSAHPLDTFTIPTTLAVDGLVSANYPQHKEESFSFSGGSKVAVYDGTIQIPFTAKIPSGAKSVKATLHYQACNDSVCLPPKDVSTELSVAAGFSPPAGGLNPTAPQSFTPLNAPHDRLSSAFLSHGLPLTLVILFLGGLALNLTPCVFPMINITVGFFAMQSDGRASRRFMLSSAYVGGIVLMYAALGWLAALSGKMFGSWLQSPAVLIGFAAAMVILATSMFGLWEMRVPQFIGRRAGGRAGFVGAAVMGLFVGIVAAPCVGPVVVALIGLVAAIAKPAIGFLMFAVLGFGLGFPYLVALTALPRPGEWMEQIKKAEGFALLAMAFYFVRPLIGDNAFRWGVAACLLIGAAYLFLVRNAGPRGGRAIRLACASLLLVAGAAFALPRTRGAEVTWKKYDAASVTATGKPVVIDFYADWCIPCKELDEKTFSNRSVAGELDRFTRVKADLTRPEDPNVQQLTKQYHIVGVPTIVFLDSAGRELDAQRLTGYEPPQQFLARLKQVR